MIRFGRRALMPCTLALSLAFSGGTAHAAVGNLSSALLQQSDAPSGFKNPHHAMVSNYARIMALPVSRGGSKVFGSICYAPAGLARSEWRQGLIETFDTQATPKNFQVLQLCAWLATSPRAAHSAFRSLVSPLRQYVQHHRARTMASAAVGAESYAVTSPSGAGDYQVVFRHGNALVALSYIGPTSFSWGNFLALARTTNSRLR